MKPDLHRHSPAIGISALCYGTIGLHLVYAVRIKEASSTGLEKRTWRIGLDWKFWFVLGAVGLALSALMCVGVVKLLAKREPYGAFMRLRLRAKLTFLRLLAVDRRLPWYVRALPLLALAYWISPIDLIPGFMPDDIALTLLVIVAVVRLTPRDLIAELLQAADAAHPSGTQE